MTSFDAIIIGAGHNGLVAAGLLAKAGRKVVVLEASAAVGGAMSVGHIVNRLSPKVIAALGIDVRSFVGELLPTVVLDAERGPAILRGGYGETVEGVGAAEVKAWAAMRSKLIYQASVLKRLLERRPARPGQLGLSDLAGLGLAGLSLIRKGRDEARDFARMALMNVADIADEYLTDDRLKGLIAFDATLGIHLGPRSPTSLLGLYYRLTGEAGGVAGGQFVPKGGMAGVARAFEQAAVMAGAEIRLAAPVTRIVSDRGRATGVILASGETLMAPVIVSAIHPATTLRALLAPGEIDTQLSMRMKHVRSQGDAARLTLALDKPAAFAGVSAADHRARLVIARSVRHVEDAFNPAKYGEFSTDPVMEITLPGLFDSALPPTLSAIVQYAPYGLKQGWEAGRPKLLAAIMAVLERHAPGISASVVSAELLVPPDIEARYHLPGGHWHHGELQVDQMLLNRPTFAVSGYDTPLAGLYLASAGSHPGGGISGLAGMNAARHILDRREA
jgi:phytoene dehydrogenase-like protein